MGYRLELETKINTLISAVSGLKDKTVERFNSGVYGIEYDKTAAAPEVTRIGDMPLHASLPVQSKMRRCLLDDDGNVNYYLDDNDSTLRADGNAAVLDGSEGQVMVEIPRHWRKFETENNIHRVLVSMTPFEGSHEVPFYYVSAYKAALERSTSKLSSVVNTDVDYRGGNDDATNDANSATLLGKPVTGESRINFRNYAQNRGGDWYDMDYQVKKTVCWLITIEYANRNHQIAVDNTLTAESYKKGGLGTGPNDLSHIDWNTFNSRYPVYDCGLTNSLGNSSGEVSLIIQDFPTSGESVTTQANSYRGIENFFGDIFEWTNGVNIDNGANAASVYIANSFKKSDTDYLGYSKIGELSQSNGYIEQIIFGEGGDIFPKGLTSASSSTYYSDFLLQNFSSKGLKALFASGSASSGLRSGLTFARVTESPSTKSPRIGSRLCLLKS